MQFEHHFAGDIHGQAAVLYQDFEHTPRSFVSANVRFILLRNLRLAGVSHRLPAGLNLDSVSTDGLRSRDFPSPRWLHLDEVNGRGCLSLTTADLLAMEPGDGDLVDLLFTVDPDVDFVESPIRIESFEGCRLRFVTDRGPYAPELRDGSVTICGPPDCAGAESTRRPAGRHRP